MPQAAVPLVTWEHLNGDDVIDRVFNEKPDMSLFTSLGDNMFLQRCDSDYCYNQMTQHYGSRKDCFPYLFEKNHLRKKTKVELTNMLEKEVGKLFLKEMQVIHELTMSSEYGNMLAVFPFNSGLYLIDIFCKDD